MRRLLILMGCSVFLILLSGCTDEKNDAVELGEEFIKALYTVDNLEMNVSEMSTEQHIEFQDEFSFYLTNKAIQDLAIERVLLTPREAAQFLNNTISVQNISLREDSVQGKDESFYFDYSFTLVFTDEDGKKVDEKEIKGQMTITNTDDGLKIQRYLDNAKLMDMLNPVR